LVKFGNKWAGNTPRMGKGLGKGPLVKLGNKLGTSGPKYPRKRATSKELKARRTNKIVRFVVDS
jgi:hypothetical protein